MYTVCQHEQYKEPFANPLTTLVIKIHSPSRLVPINRFRPHAATTSRQRCHPHLIPSLVFSGHRITDLVLVPPAAPPVATETQLTRPRQERQRQSRDRPMGGAKAQSPAGICSRERPNAMGITIMPRERYINAVLCSG